MAHKSREGVGATQGVRVGLTEGGSGEEGREQRVPQVQRHGGGKAGGRWGTGTLCAGVQVERPGTRHLRTWRQPWLGLGDALAGQKSGSVQLGGAQALGPQVRAGAGRMEELRAWSEATRF